MTGFLSSVKADLLDRRVLPILALLGVALVAALAYAVLGGGGSTGATATPTSSPAPGATGASGIPVSQAPTTTNQAVAETTSGSSQRGGGSARNPFTPLAGATSTTSTTSATKAVASSTAATSGSSTPTTSGSSTTSKSVKSGSGSSSPSSGGASPTTTPKTSSPEPLQTVYHVAVLFGVAPAGTPPPSAKLTPYENPKRETALPSSMQPLVVFRGVTAGGKSATFTLVRKAILRGAAACQPSASRCEAIDLMPGKSEELEYLTPGGAPVTYHLQLVAITSSKASTAAARKAFSSHSKAGLELLRRIGRVTLPGLRYSSAKGVLVFAGRAALAGRAHAALSRREKH